MTWDYRTREPWVGLRVQLLVQALYTSNMAIHASTAASTRPDPALINGRTGKNRGHSDLSLPGTRWSILTLRLRFRNRGRRPGGTGGAAARAGLCIPQIWPSM